MNTEHDSKGLSGVSQYHLSILDKIGLALFVVFEILMILLLLVFKLITREVTVATWIAVSLLAGNFLLPIINVECIVNRASDLLRGFSPEIDELHRLQRGKDKSLLTSLKSIKLIILLIASTILIGAGTEIYERLSLISQAISMSFLTEYAMIWFVFGDFITRCFIGLLYVIINTEI